MKISEHLPGAPSRVQRINTGAFRVGKRFIRTANPGTLDFEGYDNKGRFLGIECKRPKGGRLSPEQKARIDDINQHGGTAGVVRSGAEALELLKQNGCI
ncbi:MAG: VRR-NUC domain-containing protein [Fibrobacter sp.]|nr:VRR-NUC domain-containing protein [Fibrobacter sp.]